MTQAGSRGSRLLGYALVLTALVFATYGAVLVGDHWLAVALGYVTAAVAVAWLAWVTLLRR